jgi:hypothetical protein
MSAITQRDAGAQAVASLMPYMAGLGFANEWARYGHALIRVCVEESYEAELEFFEAALHAGRETPSLIEKANEIFSYVPDHQCLTIRADLATGKLAVTGEPSQKECRIIIDGSASGGKQVQLDAYLGICSLFTRGGQSLLARASEVLIVAKPSVAPWITQNKPHPIASTRLRLIIILPPENSGDGDDDFLGEHYADMHHAAHAAAVLAKAHAEQPRTAREHKPTIMKLVSDRCTRIYEPKGARSGSSWPMRFIISAHPSDTTDMLLAWSGESISIEPRSPDLRETDDWCGTTIVATGQRAAYWAGSLRGREFFLTGFHGRDLPSALTRPPIMLIDDSGGGYLDKVPNPSTRRRSILIWGDEQKDDRYVQ